MDFDFHFSDEICLRKLAHNIETRYDDCGWFEMESSKISITTMHNYQQLI